MKILNIQLLDILGTGSEYLWEELNKISDVSSEDTGEILNYNLPNMHTDENNTIIGRKFDWTSIYGELSERWV